MRTVRRLAQRDAAFKNAYNKLQRRVKEILKTEKQASWHQTTNQLNEKSGKEFWNTFKKLTSTTQAGSSRIPSLTQSDNSKTKSEEETANAFAKSLEEIHKTPEGLLFDDVFKKEVEEYVSNNSTIFKPDFNRPAQDNINNNFLTDDIDVQELKTALSKCKSNTAPGPDGIKFAVLKRLPEGILATISVLFSLCLFHGYFPDRWKKAHGRMILKPGKDKTNVRSYRPISLLSTTGKLFERVISKRLTCYLEEISFFNPWQKAYQSRKEASEIIYRLTEEIRYGELNVGRPWYTTALSLDVEKAFDAVWHDGLRYKLAQLGLPPEICRIVSSFLNNRSVRVKVKSTLSDSVSLMAGTPQGSVLSPLLYLIFVNDAPLGASNGCHAGQFADDINIWTTTRNKRLTHIRLQRILREIEKWCSKWRIQMNAEKTQLVSFKRNTSNLSQPLTFFGKTLKESKTLTILGLKIGKISRFTTHCKEKAAKAMQRANLLKMLRGKMWGANRKTLLRLYIQYIRPVLEYGAVAYSKTHKKATEILAIAERKCLRIILSVGPRTSRKILYKETGIQHIRKRLKHLRARTIQRFDKANQGIQDMHALGRVTGAIT